MTKGSLVLVKSINAMWLSEPVCAVVLKVHDPHLLIGPRRARRKIQHVTVEFIHGDYPAHYYRDGTTVVRYEDLDEGENAIAAHIALRMRGAYREPTALKVGGAPKPRA